MSASDLDEMRAINKKFAAKTFNPATDGKRFLELHKKRRQSNIGQR